MAIGIARARGAAQRTDLAQAIVSTVAYADVFDYPLTMAELERYLIGTAADSQSIRNMIEHEPEVRGALSVQRGMVTLAGREASMATRARRSAIADRLWPAAVRYGQQIARLPFVRMVAVTGALAVDNVEANADIDYLVITEPGRLWICRLLTIGLVRAARLRGEIICPNYFLAETVLGIDDHSLYTAHEIAQMVPLAGLSTYRRMRQINSWALRFLPNAGGAPERAVEAEIAPGRTRRVAERALRSGLGGRLERWEMERKLRKFARPGRSTEVAFSPEWCKGHFDGHGERVMAAYHQRLRALGPQFVEGTL